MLDPFDQKKQSILDEINETSASTPDLSPKGTIDEICMPIIELINSNKDMVTTSSCSGRVSVFLEGIKDLHNINDIQIGAKGNQGHWLFVTHDKESLPNWYKQVAFKYTGENNKFAAMLNNNTRYILYKFEPLILHVKCRDLTSANALYSAAMGCGFRESGIGSNNIVGIRISIKLDVPIGYLDGEEQLVSFVSQEYLEVLTMLSEDRFQENFKKLNALYKAIEILNNVPPKPEVHIESKEERRQRKMEEGMARRDAVRAEKEIKKQQKLQHESNSPPPQETVPQREL